MEFEITLTWRYAVAREHYPPGSPESMLEVDLENMRAGLMPDDLPINGEPYTVTGKVIE